MKKLLLVLLFPLLAPPAFAADPPSVTPPEEKSQPVKLPPEEPVNVQKYDPAAVKARDLPYHVTLTKAPEAWAKNPAAKGAGVKIAVIDTWGQADHPGLNGKVKRQYSAITKKLDPLRPNKPHPHCTHCAGIVHAIAPDADLYLIEVLDSTGSGVTENIAHGIDYAVTQFKVDVVSLSLGGPSTDPFLPAAIKRACDAGVIVVVAAGNESGGPGRDTEGYPARYEGATSVAACDRDRKLAPFSSWGPTVYTVKPGVQVPSLLPDNQEGDMSGTSMSCPDEAGCAASWVGSNGVPKDKERWKKYRAAVLKASPYAERNNARGYGLYTLDAVTGEVPAPKPPVPTPGERVYVVNLADLQRQGYTSVRFDLGGVAAPAAQPIPVTSLPAPQFHPHPQPVPTWTGFAPAPTWAPPPPAYQPMPAPPFAPGHQFAPQPFSPPVIVRPTCPFGQCQPAPWGFR